MAAAIGKTAGQMWASLHAHGTVSMPQRQKGTHLSARLLAMRLGWLAREGQRAFVQARPVITLRLQDAPPECRARARVTKVSFFFLSIICYDRLLAPSTGYVPRTTGPRGDAARRKARATSVRDTRRCDWTKAGATQREPWRLVFS